MMEFIQNFHFLRPWLLFFLLVPLGIYLKKLKNGGHISSWEDICDKNLLNYLLVTSNMKKISLKKYLYLGLTTAIIAAAGPTWKKIEIPTFTLENPNLFVLSIAQDMQLTDVSPSRLERAKYVISDLADNIAQGQFGLEVYSGEPYVITPITDDIKLIKNLMPEIMPNIVPDQGDRPDRALDLALERFKAAGYTQGNIILFSSDVGQRFDLALETAKKAAAAGYIVHVVDTSYDGNEKLKLLAENGKGVYLSVTDTNLQVLLDRITAANEQRVKLSQNLRSNYLDYGYYLLCIPLLCALMFFRRGVLVLMLCCFSWQAQAAFLLNNNQEGLKLFQQGKYEEALNKFTDNLWRGAAFYKLNQSEEALKEFAKTDDAEALYNSGVVLTKMCKYRDALEAFDKAVKAAPEHQDALYNQKILNELFAKAKENPEVLNCQNEQQQQNNSQQEQKQKESQTDEQQKKDSNSQNNEQQKQNSSIQPESQQKQDSNSQEPKNGENSSDNTQQQSESRENQTEQNQNSDKQNNNQQPQKDNKGKTNANSQDTENINTPTNADDNQGDEQQSQNKKGDENSGTEQQQEDMAVSLVKAKEGNNNEKYDEKALAMQRRYREIPEDTGGLLREFIKKEYMKERYRNENK